MQDQHCFNRRRALALSSAKHSDRKYLWVLVSHRKNRVLLILVYRLETPRPETTRVKGKSHYQFLWLLKWFQPVRNVRVKKIKMFAYYLFISCTAQVTFFGGSAGVILLVYTTFSVSPAMILVHDVDCFSQWFITWHNMANLHILLLRTTKSTNKLPVSP